MQTLETRSVFFEGKHEATIRESENSLNTVLYYDNHRIAEIDWKVSNDDANMILDYITDSNIFAIRFNDLKNNEMNHYHTEFIDQSFVDEMVKIAEMGIPKSLAALLSVIGNGNELTFQNVQNVAQKGVAVQIDDTTKESTLEMMYVLNHVINVYAVEQVFLSFGKTFHMQKNIYSSLINLPKEIISNVDNFNNVVLNFLIANSKMIIADRSENSAENIEFVLQALPKVKQSDFEQYEKIRVKMNEINIPEISFNDVADFFVKEYAVETEEAVRALSYIKNGIAEYIKTLSRREGFYDSHEIKKELMVQKNHYVTQLFAIVITAYGFDSFTKAYSKVSHFSSGVNLAHIVALMEYDTEFGGEIGYNLVFNIAGLPTFSTEDERLGYRSMF